MVYYYIVSVLFLLFFSGVPAWRSMYRYYGEIKNELFFKNEARNLTFWTTSPTRLGDGSNESSYLYDHVK